MLKPLPVVLVPYNPDWLQQAASRAEGLRVLGPILLDVHHFGSTAVPGLAAKPIIDLMPLVTNLADLDKERGCVEALGYEWHGEFGITGRRYCTLTTKDGVRIVQLHFFEAGSPQVERHLAFRDYLRAYPVVAKIYEMEKQRARDLHPDDSWAYTEEKTAWILKAEAAALAWRAGKSAGE